MAGRGHADYPQPELHNPKCEIELNKSEPYKDFEREFLKLLIIKCLAPLDKYVDIIKICIV